MSTERSKQSMENNQCIISWFLFTLDTLYQSGITDYLTAKPRIMFIEKVLMFTANFFKMITLYNMVSMANMVRVR